MSDETRRTAIRAAVDRRRDELVRLSHEIHADPELAFGETRAAARLTATLERAGFRVTRGVGELDTAFRAELGSSGGPTVAILAEYDALPGLGHGCGHNIIASAAVGAGLALADVGGPTRGRLVVIGTPAEEGGNGKVLLAGRGVFRGVDAAMMVHPARKNMVRRGSLANARIELVFHGKAAHAANSPDLGINALDAVIQTFVGVNAARLRLRADARVHGIVTDGGRAVNIIPDRAAAKFSVRAKDRTYVRELVAILRQIADGAAVMTGARLEWIETPGVANMAPNPTIADRLADGIRASGREVVEPRLDERMGSTDLADVSQIIPTACGYLAIAPEEVSNHSAAFAECAVSNAGDRAVRDGALALALATDALLADPAALATAKEEFSEMVADGRVAGWDRWSTPTTSS